MIVDFVDCQVINVATCFDESKVSNGPSDWTGRELCCKSLVMMV